MKLKVLIVDDEPHAVEIIARYLESFPEVEVVGSCHAGVAAFQFLRQHAVDLMFLDIKMPGLNGTALLRSLPNPPKVIFTTAYREYAVDGFDLNALDYLLKPVSFERFSKAMAKVLIPASPSEPMKSAPAEMHNDIYLYLKVDRKMMKVNVEDILWIESLRDYVKVVLKDGKTLQSKQKISLLEELLPQERFLRIHRSFIVSVNKIEGYQSAFVEVAGQELPIGRNYKATSLQRLQAR